MGRNALVAALAFASSGTPACSVDTAGLADDSTLDSSSPALDSSLVEASIPDAGETDLGVDAGGDVVDSATEPETVAVDAADAELSCDAVREVPFGGHCYSVITMPQSFLDARKACAAAPGAHLVTINAYDEDTFVGSITIGLEAWMGLVRDPPANPKLRSSFKWITGEPMSVDAWRGTEPDGTGECGRHTATGWADAACGDPYAAICERE